MLFGQEHVERYRETDGEEGHDWQGTQTLLLTTTGRRSGEQRTTPLIYGTSGDDFMIVASNGGGSPPAWYLNLQQDPAARIQVKADVYDVTTRDADADEKPDMWKTMVSEWPAYDEYQEKADRSIPVVVLSRA